MSQIPNHLLCPVCQDPFSNCVETPCCFNGYCQKCLDTSLKATRGTCPSCRQPCDIFKCRPNVMIQRMVDDLPVGCTYCDAKITRSIVEVHQRNCSARPVPSDGVHCPIHNLPFTLSCPFDESQVCRLCASIGSHRHHFQSTKDEGKEEIVQDGKEEIGETRFTADPGSAIAFACLICMDDGIPITLQTLTTILDAANIHVDRELIPLFVKASFGIDLDRFLTSLPEFQPDPDDAIFNDDDTEDAGDEAKANEEFEALRKDYHDNQFRFQGIQSRIVPICPYALQNAKNHIYFMMELKMGMRSLADIKAQQDRPPFVLAIVLDVSGSMSGSKLERAKEAILKIIENLKHGDTLHLIKYDTRAYLVFENGHADDRDQLSRQVREIETMGGTGLSYGIEMGRDILIKNAIGSDPKMIRKMFVFTDGQTDSGITSHDGIANLVDGIYKDHGIGVSAFGIGMDFDSDMMKCMADAGHGHNFFIERSDQIGSILDKAFTGLTRTVATCVTLKCLGIDGKPVRKFGTRSEDLFRGVPLGDIREKDLKQLLLEMEIQVENMDVGTKFPAIQYEISYERTDDTIPEGPIRGVVQLEVCSQVPEQQNYDPEVLVMLKIGECGKIEKEIAGILEDGWNIDMAISKKHKVIDALASVQHLDAIGFAKVLLMRAKKSLREIRQIRSGRACGAQARSLEAVAKAARHDVEEEEDGEMGFGLFD